MLGPGKYDEECTTVRESTNAAGAILMVVDGDRGHGFSVQAPLPTLLRLPDLLRSMADQIERDSRSLSEEV